MNSSRLFSSEYNVLTARIFLGALLIVASIDKIADPFAFAKSISDYRILSGPSVTFLATVLPWTELFCGLSLLSGVLLPGASLLAGSLLTVFTLAVVSALIRGLDITCGCFTQDPAAATIGWYKVGENIILIAISVFLYLSNNMRFSLEEYILHKHNERSR